MDEDDLADHQQELQPQLIDHSTTNVNLLQDGAENIVGGSNDTNTSSQKICEFEGIAEPETHTLSQKRSSECIKMDVDIESNAGTELLEAESQPKRLKVDPNADVVHGFTNILGGHTNNNHCDEQVPDVATSSLDEPQFSTTFTESQLFILDNGTEPVAEAQSKHVEYVGTKQDQSSLESVAETQRKHEEDAGSPGTIGNKDSIESVAETQSVLVDNVGIRQDENPVESVSNYAEDVEHSTAALKDQIFVADYSSKPRLVTGVWTEFSSDKENYLRGCKWSPDGSCILTNSRDNRLRIFNLPAECFDGKLENLPEMKPEVKVHDGDLVYDFCWYPGMNVADPVSCCFLTTSRDSPIRLWDSLTGQLRCSYRAFDHLDELTSAYSLALSNDGQTIYCGFEKIIRVFDISRPGRECQTRVTFAKLGQPGIISCICVNPSMDTVYAAGSYSRSIALYSEPKGEMMCMFQGQIGGVTQIKFSPDGTKLYSGGRKDPEILCWDIRNPGNILYVLQRKVTTNQRMYFDFDSTGRYVMSGNQDGSVSVWDSFSASQQLNGSEPVLQPVASFSAHKETVNSLSCHPRLPAIVTGSGQRHFKLTSISDSEDSDTETPIYDNSVKVWWMSKTAAV